MKAEKSVASRSLWLLEEEQTSERKKKSLKVFFQPTCLKNKLLHQLFYHSAEKSRQLHHSLLPQTLLI